MMQQLTSDLLNTSYPWLMVWMLVAARFTGFTLVFPLFSWLNLPMTMRTGVAGVFALPVALGLTHTGADAAPTAFNLILLNAKEIMLGAGIGFIAGVPFWGAQAAGESIDTYRGSSAGVLFDPSMTTESSELGTVLMIGMLATVLWAGGLPPLIGAIYDSMRIWPPLAPLPALGEGFPAIASGTLTQTHKIALGAAGVMLVLLFATDVALGLATRASKQFQLFDLSMSVKNLTFAVVLPLLIVPMINMLVREFPEPSLILDYLKGAMK